MKKESVATANAEIKAFKSDVYGDLNVIHVKDTNEVFFFANELRDNVGIDKSNFSKILKSLDYDERFCIKYLNPEFQGVNVSFLWSDNEFRNKYIITESGFYSIALSSNSPYFKQFKKWVTGEVLPMVRKTGMYATQSTLDVFKNGSVDEMRALIDRYESALAENRRLHCKIAEDEPKVEYYDEVLQTENYFPISVIAKDFEMSPQQLNKRLQELGVQYKKGNQWFLNQRLQGRGLADIKTEVIETADGRKVTVHNLVWSERGRRFITTKLYKSKGVLF